MAEARMSVGALQRVRPLPRRVASAAAGSLVPLSTLALLLTVPLPGQVDTRAEEIQQARHEKKEQASPEVAPSGERRLNYIQDKKIIERFVTGLGGLRLKLGGLPTGQGFALGPEYLRPDLAEGNVIFRTSAGASLNNAVLLDAQLSMPKLARERIFVDLYVAHSNYPRFEYFGPGPDSEEGSRSNFRLEQNSFDFRFGVRPTKALRLGVTGGVVQPNTGPGNREGIAQTGAIFTPLTTPGLDVQSDFLRGGFFAQFDYRDNPLGPRSGGNYLAEFVQYDDRDLDVHNFRRLDLEAQQYFPFFNKRRVIALRARTIMTFTNGRDTVPFYFQPVLGGSDDLRGFRPFRFYDDNQIVVNAEYRWEAFTGLDMALFFDAGKVAMKRSQINFHDLETAAGFGFRFNVGNATFLRIDIGFSHERTMVWLKFGNIF